MSERTDPQRAAMNALYFALRPAVAGEFVHDGLVYRGVPDAAVAGFVAAVTDGEPPPEVGVLWRWLGGDPRPAHGGDADWLGWRVGRAWAWRLTAARASLGAEGLPAGVDAHGVRGVCGERVA